jgi:nicotinamidase-related amidase
MSGELAVAKGSKGDLHGSAPDKSKAALLLIDVINDLDFPDADQLLKHALPMAQRTAALAERCRAAGVPVIYVNDNFGKWRSDFRAQVEHCLREDSRGREIAKLLRPEESDYFVLKPKHSGFFSTSLDILLEHLEVRAVILAGIAANICVLFTANDAYMRDLKLVVPRDCVASNTVELNGYALQQMATVLKADIWDSGELSAPVLAELREAGESA